MVKSISKRKFCILVQPEGSRKLMKTGICFKKKIKATTFANLETVAGMGETYFVKDMKTKKIF